MARRVGGVREAQAKLRQLEQKTVAKVEAALSYWGRDAETAMRVEAPWQDDTGIARKALAAIEDFKPGAKRVHLTHGVEYGVFLELANGRKNAILEKTLMSKLGLFLELLRTAGVGRG